MTKLTIENDVNFNLLFHIRIYPNLTHITIKNAKDLSSFYIFQGQLQYLEKLKYLDLDFLPGYSFSLKEFLNLLVLLRDFEHVHMRFSVICKSLTIIKESIEHDIFEYERVHIQHNYRSLNNILVNYLRDQHGVKALRIT